VAKDRISKTSHGFARNFTDASQESISALFTIGLLLTDAESTKWVAPGCVVVGIEEAGVGEIVPMMT